jgi:hypothetical protein
MKTKKLLALSFLFFIIFDLLTFIACEPCSSTNTEQVQKSISEFNKGDIVYLKPDSIKCVVTSVHTSCDNSYKYYLQYTDNNGIVQATSATSTLIYDQLEIEQTENSVPKQNFNDNKN